MQKWIEDLNVRVLNKTLKKETRGVNLCGLRIDSSFLDMTSKAQATKEKNKSDFIKFVNFCFLKDTIKKVKI
jgi:hypothetical protein